LENIYNAIKSDIKNHPIITSSILGIVPEWKRSQYVILSEIISKFLKECPLMRKELKQSLGNTISAITLQRFFENNYKIKTHNDLRFIKTLDKLCMFLGKEDLNTYIRDRVNKLNEIKVGRNPDLDFVEKDLILKYCQCHFDAFKKLPQINLNTLLQYVIKDSPYFTRIKMAMEEKGKKKLTFITENNSSNFEIFEVKNISDEEDLKVIKTQEFWNLYFLDAEKNKFIINHLNTQFYFLRKHDEQWRIWDNYNPEQGKILKIN